MSMRTGIISGSGRISVSPVSPDAKRQVNGTVTFFQTPYQAVRREEGRHVALKVLHSDRRTIAGEVDRFSHETWIARQGDCTHKSFTGSEIKNSSAEKTPKTSAQIALSPLITMVCTTQSPWRPSRRGDQS